jgi:acetyl-CoA synthetase
MTNLKTEAKLLEFDYAKETETLVCRFSTDMDAKAVSNVTSLIRNKLNELVGADKTSETLKIIFDLEPVDYISSLFLRAALMTAKRVKHGSFSIVKANQHVKGVIVMTGFEQWLDQSSSIQCMSHENRHFPPPESFFQKAHLSSIEEYRKMHQASIENPNDFWAGMAAEHLIWDKPWVTVQSGEKPYVKWFEGGKLNASRNCLDKHLNTPVADRKAIIWEGELVGPDGKPEERRLTYRELHQQVSRLANVLKSLGVAKGDRVLIYLPMVPEAVAAMLACARIGAIHCVVFAGFSSQAIAERIDDCQASFVITADGSFRKGSLISLKNNVDEALQIRGLKETLLAASAKKVLVLRRAQNNVAMKEGRDYWWHEEMENVPVDCPPESMDSEDPLFILYTSGSTGKPKGIFPSTAGYLLGASLTFHYVFDIKEDDKSWCTADVGWITGHSYVVYGPLARGAQILMYEGAPNYPDPSRFWKIIEKYRVTIFYTAPTAIRSFMQWGDEHLKKHDLSSLRLLGTVGEPINPQAWIWYQEKVGGSRCPIVDTWWQTETGSIMISAIPGAIPTKPGAASVPFFGIQPDVVDEEGNSLPSNSGGKLIIRKPWPSMLRGIWNDPALYELTYWSEIPGCYFTGDGARKDEDGYFWIMGRIDDVINVSGHRIGTAEIESAMVSHPSVAEAAAVGRADDTKGSAIVVFATLKSGVKHYPGLNQELKNFMGKELGAIAKPDEVRISEALPKTRSGKIMRRLLKQVACGMEVKGDMTTLEDFTVLAKLSGEEG